MKKMFKDHAPGLAVRVRVKNTKGKGRGVFAMEDIKNKKLIERCPALVFNESNWDAVQNSPFGIYVFIWRKKGALALGATSMVNHSSKPNARVVANFKNGTLELWAVRNIGAKEEITIDYGPGYEAEWKK